jgi:hypothetical protein
MVRSQPRQIYERPYLEKLFTKIGLDKKRTGRVVQGEGPEFKPQYHKKNFFEDED